MWKIIAVICVLEYPDYTMLPELECTQFADAKNTLFDNKNQCEIVAQRRHDETIALFKKARQPIESLKVSCVQ
tara:strand:+ start:1862 stop:2080 length:219 start_codon:yes stop_codon:yes gene_type:complete